MTTTTFIDASIVELDGREVARGICIGLRRIRDATLVAMEAYPVAKEAVLSSFDIAAIKEIQACAQIPERIKQELLPKPEVQSKSEKLGKYQEYSVTVKGRDYIMPAEHIARITRRQVGKLLEYLRAGNDVQDWIDRDKRRINDFLQSDRRFFILNPEYSGMLDAHEGVQ